ncbi:2-desacetyl-2-hydroxyethyl bacteriochlorophyllide A dehydrogenase [Streptomyces sp. SAI-208]|uniref:zinc-dependent alcohol dehydrogenase n=1 Tax=unclassified Streptomyces TaxID=2593676 RepID=UPI00247591A5|nr:MULTISPECIES: alcohol dehydrogenase catalytic domain-containing protein [unclassified Streptomyces]MDH6547940.1 2-desacetyl-2-hydroxyethyl bacteriochlorophyllide A dehydrogenase [Streptomyces sp. SAI-041]MDH6606561.1 2-desacetyl-2-hydroxyethyl bacteriochlorophyllide A dehydrogenase [Streptomyces sp. SAI-208]
MKVIQLTAPRTLSVTETAPPEPGPGEVLVRVGLLGLCGTDLGFYDGSSNYLRDGLKSYPFVLGHEWTGTVVGAGPGTGPDLLGRRVSGHNFRVCGRCAHCRAGRIRSCPDRSEIGVLGPRPGAGAQLITAPLDTLTRIPDGLSDAAGALLEPTAAAAHAVDRLTVTASDRVAVLGAGTLGLAAAQITRAIGADTLVLDPQPAARALAAELGLRAQDAPGGSDAEAYDAVIEASGSAAGVRAAVRLVASGGRIAQLGTPHRTVDGFDAAALVIRDVTLHGVLSGIGYWDRLVGLVESGAVNLDALVDRVFPLEELDAAFAHLADGGRDRPKVLVRIDPALAAADRA